MNEHDDSLTSSQRPWPFEHVYLATDFSGGAAEALARVRRLPMANRAKITVVHVLSAQIPQKACVKAEKVAQRQLEQSMKGLGKAAGLRTQRNVKVSSGLCQGQAYVEIIRRARVAGADLIVLGRHGRRPVRDMFLGSTAARVIRAGDPPVLVVCRRARRGYQRPLIAVDLGDTCRSVVAEALRVVEPDLTNATMVHAYHVPFEGFLTPASSPGEMTELRKEYRQAAAAGLAKLQSSLEELGFDGGPASSVVTPVRQSSPKLFVVAPTSSLWGRMAELGSRTRFSGVSRSGSFKRRHAMCWLRGRPAFRSSCHDRER